MSVADNVQRIRARIAEARDRGGWVRDVRIVAVIKGRSPAEIREVLAAGIHEVAENRVQEARGKWPELADDFSTRGVRRHLVGHLQRNKVGAALELFDLIQSVDSLPLASKIAQSALDRGRDVEIFLQVNAGAESQKHGFGLEELEEAAAQVAEIRGLRLGGVMAVAPLEAQESALRALFARVREGVERLRAGPGAGELELSMGMSGDFEAAVEEGATMVRVGTALFVGG